MGTAALVLKVGDVVEVIAYDIDKVPGTSRGTRGTVTGVGLTISSVKFPDVEERVLVYTRYEDAGEVKVVEHTPATETDESPATETEASIDPASLAQMERRNALLEELGRITNTLGCLGDVVLDTWEFARYADGHTVMTIAFNDYKEAN